MEEGSLLNEALEYMKRLREGSEEDAPNDVLQIDVFELEPPSNRCEQLLCLASLANSFNDEIGNYYYIWYAGSPPIFAIHVSSGIPHLRAVCRYGNNVNDEWTTIRIMLDLSKRYPTLAIDVWDLGLGLPILLIEGSEGLPEWIAEGEVDNTRHLCWVVEGSITVIGPTQVGYSLKEALDYLKERKMLIILEEVQAIVSNTLDKIPANCHRAPLILPRPVALLLQHMPQLANAAAVAYEKAGSLPATNHDDWVWTTSVMARTNYAILRTVQPKAPTRLSPELKRFQRTCANEATTHLRYALEVGMRLTAGVDVLLLKNQDATSEEAGISPIERRMLRYWPRVDIECGGDGDWLQQAWQMGPNRSSFDLTYFLKCPVFTEEQQYPYPISHPGSTMAQLIRSEMKRKSTDEIRSVMPRPEDVDDEEWMHRGEEALQEAIANRIPGATPEEQTRTVEARGAQELDNVMKGFDKFMSGESGIEGVSHEQTVEEEISLDSARQPSAARGPDEPIQIKPRVFLNLLREVLVASPEELERKLTSISIDPYFSEQDYALMEPDDSLDEDATDFRDVSDMEALMHAMDSEIAQSRKSGEGKVHSTEESLTADVHILSNLARSLGASAGAPGPVSNILQELGVDPPMLHSEDIDESEDQ